MTDDVRHASRGVSDEKVDTVDRAVRHSWKDTYGVGNDPRLTDVTAFGDVRFELKTSRRTQEKEKSVTCSAAVVMQSKTWAPEVLLSSPFLAIVRLLCP